MDPQLLELMKTVNGLAREVSTLTAQVAWLSTMMNYMIGAQLTAGSVFGGALAWMIKNNRGKKEA